MKKRSNFGAKALYVSILQALALVSGLLFMGPLHAQNIVVWNTGNGNWSVATNWTPNTVPNTANDFAQITTTNTAVTADGAFTVGELTINSGDNLVVSNGQSFTVTTSGAFSGTGTITNAGSISLNGTTNNTFLVISGNATLTGGGTVNLVGNDVISPGTANAILTNVNNTIQGETTGGALAQLGIVNEASGLIDANVSGKALIVEPGPAGVTNTGTMEASSGGILDLSGFYGGVFTNTGGTIQALNVSEVGLFNGVSINGGTLTTAGNGTINAVGTASLTNVTNTGTFIGNDGSSTTLAGTITNAGTISLNATVHNTFLAVSGNTTLTGGGTVNLVGNDVVSAGTANAILTNVNNTIQGETNSGGDLGAGQLGIVNEANGLIDANISGKALVVEPGSAGVTNTGIMEASSGGILDLSGFNSAVFTNTGGTIRALAGSDVGLIDGASIMGGTLTTVGNGTINTVDSASLTNVTNAGTFIGNDGSDTTIAGVITNTGTISLNATTHNTFLVISGNTSLTGGGTVNLVTNDVVAGTSNGILTNVNNVIQGETGGGSLGGTQLGIINEANGLIDANVSGKSLLVEPGSSGLTNTGIMEASSGGILDLSGFYGGVFTNTGGTIQALNVSEVGLFNGVSINGGTLTTAGNGTINAVGTASLTNVTNTGTFIGNDGSSTTLAGTITNAGTISLNATVHNTFLAVSGNTTLTGGGTVNLVGNDVVSAGTANAILTNVNNTIQGETNSGGDLGAGQLGIVNEANGLIDANISGKALVVEPGSAGVTNTGIMEASSGGILDLSGFNSAVFTNTGGTIRALAGSDVGLIDGASIMGGTLTTVGNGTINTVDSASLTNVTNAGTFIGNDGSDTTIAGVITNTGTISLNATTHNTFLVISGNTSLTGGGTVNLVTNDVVAGTSNGILTNVNNVIQGETGGGSLGGTQLGIINEANGLIDANVSGKSLLVEPGSSGLTNTGIMEASSGGILDLSGNGSALFTNTGGTIQALNGSEVDLINGASIIGGTLTTVGNGTINTVDSASLTNVTNAGTFIGDDGSTTTIAGTITNTGAISLNATTHNTFLVVNGNTSLTGGGTINLVSNDVVVGSGNGVLTNVNDTIQGETGGGSLGGSQLGIINEANGLINANVSGKTLLVEPGSPGLTNTGIMEASSGGNLSLSGFSGGVFTNTGGTIQALNGSEVDLINGASIKGGTLTTAGGGTINTVDSASLTNVINAGTFIGDDGSTTTIAGVITNTGTVSLNAITHTTFLAISGNTSLNGSGTVNLVSNDVVAGNGTLTNNSTIQGETNTGGNIGGGQLSIANNGLIDANVSGKTLAVSPANTINSFVNNATGIAEATNGGTLLFTSGNGIFINNGTLEAASGSTISVNGTLNGTGLVTGVGTLINANFASDGTVRPGMGGNPGTLTITGNYTQNNDGTLVIQVNGTTPGTGYSVLQVSGSAALGGALQVQGNGLSQMPTGQTLTILTAGTGVTGTFTNLNSLSLSGIGYQIIYNSDNVQLQVQQLLFARAGLTPNQLAVAQYLDRVAPVATGSVGTFIGDLNVLPSTELPGALDQLMPLKFANFTRSTTFNNASFSTQAFDNYLANHRGSDGTLIGSNGGIDYSGLTVNNPNVDSGLQTVYSRLLAWNPAPSTGLLSDTPAMDLGGIDMKDTKTLIETSETPANPWNVFISGNVVLAQDFSDPSAGTSHADSTTGAVQAGADYKITQHFLVGAEFAYGHTSATLDNLGSTASVDTYSPGVYASYSEKGWYANALGSYGFDNYDQNRKVAIGAFNGTANSSPGGDQIVGNLDGGYDFHRGSWTFGPTLGAQYTHLDVNGYTETGLPGADLTVNQNETDSLRNSLGGRISYAIKDGGVLFNPHLSASWQHEFLDQSRGITSQFNGLGGGSFVVNTPNSSRDSALVDVGLDTQINNALTAFVDYSVQAGQSNYFGQSVQAGFKIGF